MQPTGVNPSLIRILPSIGPDLLTELFTPGKVLDADVVSVFQDRAILSFGRGVRLEVALQAPLQEGQRVRVQVQAQPGAAQAPTAQAGPEQPAPQQQTAPQAQQTAPRVQPQPATPQLQQPVPQAAAPIPPTVSAFAARQAASLGTAPQQLLRPMAPPQTGAPTELPPAQAQQPAGNPPPVVLKVIATLPPRDSAPAAAPDQATAPVAAKATGIAAAVREALTTPAQTPAPVNNQQPAQQQNAPQVFWLPIPLPDGKQGWAQLHIQEDDSPRARSAKGGPAHEVRIWWETPALGAVQVTLDAAADKLAALFTAAAPESKGALETLLPELQRRLSQVGFPEARIGCRTAAPGEAVEPARAQGASRLDKRL